MLMEAYLESVSERFDSAGLFYGHGTDNAWDEAVYLVFTALGFPFDGYEEVLAHPLTAGQIEKTEALVERRIRDRVPVAYLVGEAWFAGLPFYVDERVLIPRSPTGELIQQSFETLIAAVPRRILDLCTGSGCIGIACALEFPAARVDLADISTDALLLARRNLERYQLGERVQTFMSDLFSGLPACSEEERGYDLIISNPPYVSREEIDELPPEYRQEPELGLLSDDDGLAIPLQILRQAPDWLTEQGVLILEVGYSCHALQARFPDFAFQWLEFAQGGEGVLRITRAQLLALKSHFPA